MKVKETKDESKQDDPDSKDKGEDTGDVQSDHEEGDKPEDDSMSTIDVDDVTSDVADNNMMPGEEVKMNEEERKEESECENKGEF